jgi:Zn-dependent alcohol dehydrogenase
MAAFHQSVHTKTNSMKERVAMATPLNVAVIGVGGIARTHMPGWQASTHAEVVAGADINPTMLENWGKEHGVTQLYTSTDELLRNPDIDIIDICVPNMHSRHWRLRRSKLAST